jgi:hypothetical protein
MCASCGAPDTGELVICRFCQRPISDEVLRSAIPCPRCAIPNRWGKQRCVACGTWVVVSCVFCGALSPHNQQACLSCREPFAGAMERKAQRANAQSQAQASQMMGMFGNVAASFFGGMAGGAVAGGLSHAYHGHYHPSWDSSSGSYGSSSNDDPPIGTMGDTSTGIDYGSGGGSESFGGDGGSGDGGSTGGGSSDGGDGG